MGVEVPTKLLRSRFFLRSAATRLGVHELLEIWKKDDEKKASPNPQSRGFWVYPHSGVRQGSAARDRDGSVAGLDMSG